MDDDSLVLHYTTASYSTRGLRGEGARQAVAAAAAELLKEL